MGWKCCSRGCRVIASYGSCLSSLILLLLELRGRRQLGVLVTSRDGMGQTEGCRLHRSRGQMQQNNC